MPIIFVRKAALKCLTLGDFLRWKDLFVLYFGLFFVRLGNLMRLWPYFSKNTPKKTPFLAHVKAPNFLMPPAKMKNNYSNPRQKAFLN
jgi:hypothetical protein